ncbi:HAD family hydrolase [Demequina aurantiaca]|uniref:HAD family hydrolase n=1 Tax=Demequina aurantiaca TaxID=676200 RepID=UPI003D33272E
MTTKTNDHGQGLGVAAFFDVDNTIIRGASAFHIARALKQRGYFGTRDILKFGWEQGKYLVLGETDEQMEKLRTDGVSIVKGWSVAEMATIGEDVYDEVLALRIFPGTKKLLDDHLAKGHQVWLVTASPVEIGRVVAKRLGATGALGTTPEQEGGYYTGKLNGPMLHGKGKAEAITKLAATEGLDLTQAFAYGDSINDSYMLSAVGHPCAINPDTKLRKYALSHGWEIQEFRDRRKNGRRGIVKASVTGFVWVTMAVMRGITAAVTVPLRKLFRSRKSPHGPAGQD